MKGSMWVKLLCFVAIVIGCGLVLRLLAVDLTQFTPQHVRTFILSFGLWAPAVYLAAYGQPLVPLPASVMTLAGGLAFGSVWGTLAALGGATLRACTEFLVARLLGREAVAKLLKGTVASLDEKLGQNSFKAVLLIRLIPNVPFDMQNYGLGFSRVRFGPYLLATVLGIVPGSFAYVYLGESLTNPKQIWKLGVAILLIVGLIVGQSALKARAQRGTAAEPPHA